MKNQENLYCATCLKTGKQFYFYNFNTIEKVKENSPDYEITQYKEETFYIDGKKNAKY